jgi:hypothetical protein
MILKSGKKEYTLNPNDRIMFNGRYYILITQPQACNDIEYGPVLKTNSIKKLIGQGELILADEKYPGGLDLYKIKENNNG